MNVLTILVLASNYIAMGLVLAIDAIPNTNIKFETLLYRKSIIRNIVLLNIDIVSYCKKI